MYFSQYIEYKTSNLFIGEENENIKGHNKTQVS